MLTEYDDRRVNLIIVPMKDVFGILELCTVDPTRPLPSVTKPTLRLLDGPRRTGRDAWHGDEPGMNIESAFSPDKFSWS
ncbi:uncharacterized protein N7469_004618 [Penicillium citrinum]|uniref:Uncharacterized protein n=1 Tax=Penicillium citrinum TaxID=5077 RepID=A0A9W9TQR1_PENCI|nr:uncharacterized protein N7469_004618 [Penicillium citrinum]KAJ5235450.1 hypothetical protein N7469_004618 [Penicillium citrinum]